MVKRDAIVEHPAGGPLEGNFRQNNASPLPVTFRHPYNELEGVLKWDTLLEHTSQEIQVKKISIHCGNTSPPPYRLLKVSIIKMNYWADWTQRC